MADILERAYQTGYVDGASDFKDKHAQAFREIERRDRPGRYATSAVGGDRDRWSHWVKALIGLAVLGGLLYWAASWWNNRNKPDTYAGPLLTDSGLRSVGNGPLGTVPGGVGAVAPTPVLGQRCYVPHNGTYSNGDPMMYTFPSVSRQ